MLADTVPTKPRNGPRGASRSRFAADIAGIGQASDRAQCELLAAAGDHDRRARLLHRLRLENRILDMKIPAVKCRPLFGPHCDDQPDGFRHLPDAYRRTGGKLPAILTVFGLEIAGADAAGQPSPAVQIDAGGDLGEMRRIAIGDLGGERRQTNAAGHRGQGR